MAISIETFFLDQASEGTLQAQIQQMIAQGILEGRFRANERLPSSRKMAAHLGVSRITVTLAYTELVADDYLYSKGRSGYYVSENAPEPTGFVPQKAGEGGVDWSRFLNVSSTVEPKVVKPANWSDYKYPFIYGQVDPTLFDNTNWRLCALQALGKRDFNALTSDYYDQDDPLLVEFISRQILPRRGILAPPQDILLTMGAQNALWLTSQILLGGGQKAVIENPCYPELRGILQHAQCYYQLCNVDERGIVLEDFPAEVDVSFVTPSHQCPTGVTMPLSRRKEFLTMAKERDFVIVEDDYEFEMSFSQAPSPSLKSLDHDGRVVYIGSFSKSLFPGLRLGYLVGPAPFIAAARALRAVMLRHPPGHIQRTVAYYLSLGYYDSQLRRTSKSYQQRRDALLSALEAHDVLTLIGDHHGGSSVWVALPEEVSARECRENLLKKNVLVEAGDMFYGQKKPPQNYIRLAYSSIAKDLIQGGVNEIANEVERMIGTQHD